MTTKSWSPQEPQASKDARSRQAKGSSEGGDSKRDVRGSADPSLSAKSKKAVAGPRPGDDSILSPEQLNEIIRCVEQEYGIRITPQMKATLKKEISLAVPELTKAILPLVQASVNNTSASDPSPSYQDLIKAFMQVMLPHMQRIVNSAQ